MNNIKKVLSILFIGIISIMLIPRSAYAKDISTLDVKITNNKFIVSGTTENGMLAVAVLVYSGEDLLHMETCSNNNNSYSCELSKNFDKGNYVVKVADYDGGDYVSKSVSVNNKIGNPKTGDNIIISIVIGTIGVLGIGLCALIFKRRKRFN